MLQPTVTLGARYQIRGALGEGGMGTVYRVEDTETGVVSACKLLGQAQPAEADVLRFKQEFRAMARLRHPNVCEVRDFGQTPEGTPFFTMEVVPGQGLDELRDVSPADLLPLIAQMGAALGYVHAQGYVHGDVKPDNLRVKADGTVKLMDFGLMVAAGQRHDGIAGTLAYLSPEAAKGDRLDQRSDLYSLGAVLYELVTGEQPIRGATPLDVLRGHLQVVPPPPRALAPGVPEALDAAIMKLLAKEPAQRFASAGDLLAFLGLAAQIDEAARLLESPFVGRKPELVQLEEALASLAKGQGGVVRISGAAGSGKGRLLDELRVRAQLAGRPAIYAAAEPDDPPFGPLVAAVRQVLPLARELAPEVLAAEAPALAAALPELASGPVEEGENGGVKLQAALARVLAAALGRARGVLLLDKWNLADAASRTALAFLERNAADFAGTPELPFLLVVAGRDAADGAGAVPLSGLATDETRALIAGILGQPDAPAPFCDQLQGLTEGNPRTLVGLLAQAVANGALTRAAGAWKLPDLLPVDAITTDVRHGLLGRLAGLPEDARALARAAALLGEPFELAHLAAAAGVVEDAAIDHTEALVRAGVLDNAHGRYRFALAELRALLAEELDARGRARIHGAAGAHLQAHPPAGANEVWLANAIARHLLAGGPAEDAIPAALEASRRLQSMGGAESAMVFLRQAFERLVELPDTATWRAARMDVLLYLAWTHAAAYDLAQADALVDELIGVAEAEGDASRLARAYASKALQCTLRAAPATEIDAVSTRALELARAAGDFASLARAGSNFGRWLVLQGQSERGRQILEDALAAARTGGHAFYEARAMASLGFALGNARDTRDQGIALMREAIALQVRHRDRYGEGFTHNLLYGALSAAGRWDQAADVAQAGGQIMRETDAIDDLILALANQAGSAVEIGDAERAAKAGRESLALARGKQHRVGTAYAAAIVGRALAQTGQAAEALPLLEEADPIARELGGYILQCILPHIVSGFLYAGMLGRARTALQEGVFTLRGSGGQASAAMLATLQAQLFAAEGSWKDSQAQAAEARGVAEAIGADGLHAHALAIAAVGAAAEGRGADAQRLADEGQALAGKLGLRPILALLAGLRGEVALADNPGEAMAHFQAMQVLADALGSPILRARALYGQVLAMPSAPHAASVLDQAQRALRDLAARLPEAEALAFLESPVAAEVLTRNPAIAQSAQASGGKHPFIEQFARVNGDLQALFAQYGALQKDWEGSVARLRRLNELASQMGSHLLLEEVLPQVVALTLEITGAERGFVVLRGDDRYGNLACRAAYDHEGNSLAASDWSLSICQKVMTAGQAIAILDASADADFQAAKSIVAFNVRTVMGVPMIAKGQLIGVLYVDSSAVVTTFTEADLEMLRGIALHAAVAIDNARLYEQLGRHAAELEEALAKYRKAEAEATTDLLTGLPNRRKFVDESEREIGLARRFGHPVAVCILDVDHFKKFNDTYGHALGDEVLKVVGQMLREHVGPGQTPARLGGEEFTILVPAADHAAAIATAERVREAIAAVVLNDDKGVPVRQITASFGVATLLPADKSLSDVLERADAALYAAKHGGRNQVMLWREGMTAH